MAKLRKYRGYYNPKGAGKSKRLRSRLARKKARSFAPAPRPALVRTIKQVVNSLSETKQVYYNSGNSLTFFNSGIDAVGDLQQIVPNMANGTEDNQRIGQTCRAKSLNVRGYIKLNVNDVNDSTRLPSVIVRMMIVSLKTAPNFNEAQAQAPKVATLLKKGGTTTTFSGILSDINSPINTDVFTVHHDRKFYLNQSYVNATGPSPPSTIVSQDIKNTVKFFNLNVKCKNKILKYDEDVSSDLLPTNFAPFLLLGYSYLDGSTPDTLSTNVGLQYISTLNYEDA